MLDVEKLNSQVCFASRDFKLDEYHFPNGNPQEWRGEMLPDQRILCNPFKLQNIFCFKDLLKQFRAPFKALAVGPLSLPEGLILSRAVKLKSALKSEQMHLSAIVERDKSREVLKTFGFNAILKDADARAEDTWKILSDNAQRWRYTNYQGFDLIYIRNPSLVGGLTKSNWLPIFHQAINNLNPEGQIITVIEERDLGGFLELKEYLDQEGSTATKIDGTKKIYDYKGAHAHIAVTERSADAPFPLDLIALPA